MNILDFSGFLFDFSLFKKRQKGSFFLHRTYGADMVRKATWKSCASPHGVEVAQRWRGRVAGPRKSTRTLGWRHVAV